MSAPGTPRRDGPLRRWRGLTWVGWLNAIALRWVGLRVYYQLEEDGSISRYGVRWMSPFRW